MSDCSERLQPPPIWEPTAPKSNSRWHLALDTSRVPHPICTFPLPIPHHHLAPQLTQSTPRYSFLVPCAAYGRVKGEDLQERASGFRCFEKAEGAYRLELKRNSPSTGCSTGRDDCIAGLTFDRRIAWMEMRRVERGCAWMVWCAIGWVWLASGDAGWSDMGWRVVG